MTNRTFISLFSISACTFFALNAFADVAPPEDYVEQCTIEKKQTDGKECIECQGVRANEAGRVRCKLLLEPYCYEKACDAWGGTAYKEIWCRKSGSQAVAVPEAITKQLTGYEAADVSAATGAPAKCDDAPPTGAGGSSSVSSSSAEGGKSSQSSATTKADGGASDTSSSSSSSAVGGKSSSSSSSNRAAGGATSAQKSTHPTSTTTSEDSDESNGCSIALGSHSSSRSVLSLLGLLGMAVLLGRKRTAR